MWYYFPRKKHTHTKIIIDTAWLHQLSPNFSKWSEIKNKNIFVGPGMPFYFSKGVGDLHGCYPIRHHSYMKIRHKQSTDAGTQEFSARGLSLTHNAQMKSSHFDRFRCRSTSPLVKGIIFPILKIYFFEKYKTKHIKTIGHI